jgi:hypothetical protein
VCRQPGQNLWGLTAPAFRGDALTLQRRLRRVVSAITLPRRMTQRRTGFRRISSRADGASNTRSATSRAGPGRSSLCRSNSTCGTCRRVDHGVGNAATPALRVRQHRLRCRDLYDVGRTGSRRSHSSALGDRPRAYAARRRSMAGDRRDRPLRNRRDRRGGDPDDLGRMEPGLAACQTAVCSCETRRERCGWSSPGVGSTERNWRKQHDHAERHPSG